MKKYKVVILGPQCAGKTTIKKYLEEHASLPLVEEDELFTQLNGGEYPNDIDHKEKTLRPLLEEQIRNSDNMIFLTSYSNLKLLQELKDNDYKIIQLELSEEEFQKRNTKRMNEQGYDDANVWAKEIFGFHKQVKEAGLIDEGINANQPVADIARQVIDFLE